MTSPHFESKKVTPHCGAEVRGLDLSQPLDEDSITALVTTLAEHGVLFFRDQEMTPAQQKSSSRNSSADSNGSPARSRSGTTAAPSTTPCGTTTRIADADCG